MRWGQGSELAWDAMSVTGQLDDNSEGDTATGELAADSDAETHVCRYLDATADLTAQIRMGTVHGITRVTWQGTLSVALEGL